MTTSKSNDQRQRQQHPSPNTTQQITTPKNNSNNHLPAVNNTGGKQHEQHQQEQRAVLRRLWISSRSPHLVQDVAVLPQGALQQLGARDLEPPDYLPASVRVNPSTQENGATNHGTRGLEGTRRATMHGATVRLSIWCSCDVRPGGRDLARATGEARWKRE